MEVLISIADQKMAVMRDGGLIQKFQVSTSRFGAGDAYRSYKTPLGQLRVCDKVGNDLMPGAVIKHRSATGEVLDVNAPGRDPIVTRILWLEGLEEQNRNAKERGIYIHGTPEEKKLGEPVSWGCIRMRSQDVVQLFDEIPIGASVKIIAERLPRLPKYEPPKPMIIVARKPAPTPAPVFSTPSAASRIATTKTAPAGSTPLPAASRIAVVKTLPKSVAVRTPTPYVPSGLLIAKAAPEIAAVTPPKRSSLELPEIADGPHKTIPVLTSSGNTGALAAAMKGSILFAGLPEGPAPQSISTAEPKKLLHAAPLSVAAPPDGLSLNRRSSPDEPTVDALFPSPDAHGHLAARIPLPTPGEAKTADPQ
jgi:hypothetical protein